MTTSSNATQAQNSTTNLVPAVPPRPQITAANQLVTPELASEWLTKHNSRNRPLNAGTVKRYKKDMLEGQWKMNGDSIVFDPSGELLNGQHRLTAVVESGRPIWALTVRGVDPSAFGTYDIGKKRSAGDILGISGEYHDTEKVAASLGLVVSYENHQIKGNRWEGIPNTQIVTEMSKHPDILASQEFCKPWKRTRTVDLPWPNLIALHYLFTKASNPEVANGFIKSLMEGADLHEDNPVHVLRQRFLTSKKLERVEKVKYIILAWNAVVTNTKLAKNKLKFTLGDELPAIKKLDGENL